MVFYAPGGTQAEPQPPDRAAAAQQTAVGYGLALMQTAVDDLHLATAEGGATGGGGGDDGGGNGGGSRPPPAAEAAGSWRAYYAAQWGRFRAHGLPEPVFEALMAGILQDAAVEFAGFAYSLGSSLLELVAADAPADRAARLAAVGRLGKPSLALWGTADTDVPFAQHQELLRRVPHCALRPFVGESHMFFQKAEMEPVVADAVAGFVQKTEIR
jgi:pimeloyl-ACP methyl ester carboxylesterase